MWQRRGVRGQRQQHEATCSAKVIYQSAAHVYIALQIVALIWAASCVWCSDAVQLSYVPHAPH